MNGQNLTLERGRRHLIFTHNNPDPDALASAWALARLVESQTGKKPVLAYGGTIGRAENRAMVRELQIPMKPVESLRARATDRYILVDTQPGSGNHSLPAKSRCVLVVDHHRRRRGPAAETAIIDTEAGATATILVEWLLAAEEPISAKLATALAYAIRSETQDLGREAGVRDMRAFLHVIARASLKTLSRIVHPKLPETYFLALSRSLDRVRISGTLAISNLGDIPYPEFTAEVADLLLRTCRITWTLAYGRMGNALFLSIRSTRRDAKAGQKIKKLVPDPRMAGGHDTFAGGRVDLLPLSRREQEDYAEQLPNRMARLVGHPNPVWRQLTDHSPC